MKICVFGAASAAIDQCYIDAVERLTEEMARRGHSLVFGAGGSGLMGAAARGTKRGGGYIHGVIPNFFREERLESIFGACDKLTFTETMAERKTTMEDDCDAFIIVPGGIGTLEEFFEVITLKQLGRHHKAIAFYNIDGYYDPERASRPEVTASSKVTITFRAYVFTFSNITDSTFPFYSNDASLRAAYEELGLTVDGGVWSFEPLTIEMGGGILNGIRTALLGCRERDYVEAYMTYDVAFGGKNFSTIPRESPIAFFFTVQSVE